MVSTRSSSRSTYRARTGLSRFDQANALARRMRRLTEEQTDAQFRDSLLLVLDAWLFQLEDLNLQGRVMLVKPWLRLREVVRVFEPDENRDSIVVQNAIDLVFQLQERLVGIYYGEDPSELEEPSPAERGDQDLNAGGV